MSFIPRSLPFFATQIINPFLSSKVSANYDEVEGFQLQSCYPYYFSIVEFHLCQISNSHNFFGTQGKLPVFFYINNFIS